MHVFKFIIVRKKKYFHIQYNFVESTNRWIYIQIHYLHMITWIQKLFTLKIVILKNLENYRDLARFLDREAISIIEKVRD